MGGGKKMEYPGDTSTPEELAQYMARFAEKYYALPGILPVMVVAVEMRQALSGAGDLKDIPGYLWPEDGCSVGAFQQQADDLGCGHFGWGTRDELVQLPIALERFCERAESLRDAEWHAATEDPEVLGRWCVAIQAPLEALEYRYEEEGYPLAKAILGEEKDMPVWPTTNIGFDAEGWAMDLEANSYLKSTLKNETLYTDPSGWLYRAPEKEKEPEKEPWSWPEANTPPSWGSYVARHPTRYTWRSDVEKLARHLVDGYDVWVNTYYDHPEGYGRDTTSFDVWGPGGRGDPLDPTLGQWIFNLLFNDPAKPDLDWIIWNATIYGGWNGWAGEGFGSDPFTWHYDHIHCTYK